MQILNVENKAFELDQIRTKLNDLRICVLDCSEKDNIDFFFKKITSYLQYRQPAVELQIGDKQIVLPLNWKILCTNDEDYTLEIVNIEDLIHETYYTPVFNPLHVYVTPAPVEIKVLRIIPSGIEWFVPKLPKKTLVALPIGSEKDYKTTKYDSGETEKYPECIFAMDDLNSLKLQNVTLHDVLYME